MAMENRDRSVNGTSLWSGRVVSGLPVLFLIFDGVMKLVKPAPVIEATVKLGYPPEMIVPLGVTLLVCTALYLFPRTAALGAILLTGYLGGAVASHVRAGQGAFPVLFPIVFAILIWAGLVLRRPQMRSILPLTE